MTWRRRRGGWVKASYCRSATPPASEASLPWQEPGQTWSSSDRWSSTNSQQRHPHHVTTCPVRPDSQLPVSSSQALPSERWRDQLCLLVCLCFPHHGANADPGLVLAAVPLRGLQVSHSPKHNPNITVTSPTAPTTQLYSYKHDWVFLLLCTTAWGRRGVAVRSSRRRSGQHTRSSGTSIPVWDPWATESSAFWHFSSSWWRCGSHETHASWRAGRRTCSTPKLSEYQRNLHECALLKLF